MERRGLYVESCISVEGGCTTSLSCGAASHWRAGSARLPMVRILVVKDTTYIRDWVRDFLPDQSGWQVCGEAENGILAVEQAASLQPHIIILDVTMPGISGFEAARRILKASPDILILILSLNNDRQYAGGAKECGAKGFVVKSNAAMLLIPAISALLRGELHFPSVAAT
jgi:DNA-binding NarL/FixJ family response regulator